MKSSEVRQKFLDFYKNPPRNHAIIPSAPLIPENDPSTLFISAGMQPLILNILGQPHPSGKRLADSQKSFRSQDIDEVGDNRHTTFFEMLGNWSLGDYFKKEQLPWIFEFLTKELKLPKNKLFVSVFEGTASVPKDTESFEIWKKLGIPEDKIYFYGVKKNWWSRSGEPDKMPSGEPGGPDSEVFYDFGTPHNPKFGKECHPNCECGRFLEIGNSVFMQYQKQSDGSLKELKQQNVDFGGGLERLTAATNNDPDIFNTDLFFELKKTIENYSHVAARGSLEKFVRIFLDHTRAIAFMISEGVIPDKHGRGYVLRSLIRRTSDSLTILGIEKEFALNTAIKHFKNIYRDVYSNSWDVNYITGEIINELRAYGEVFKNIEKEKNELEFLVTTSNNISAASAVAGPIVFNYQSSFGVPYNVAEQIAKEVGLIPNIVRDSYLKKMKEHKELSRKASAGKFKGGLADQSEQTTKLHTATHLLHQALRTVLGNHVSQKGSNITAERLRFDFSHPTKLTPEEIKKVEDLVNEKIRENLPVKMEILDKEKALGSGALAFFAEKYADKVKVYSIGNFSREICGGPHVTFTGELGRFKIAKEESAGSGIRRIYATLTPYGFAKNIRKGSAS